jgi:hypothetical protein
MVLNQAQALPITRLGRIDRAEGVTDIVLQPLTAPLLVLLCYKVLFSLRGYTVVQ